MHKDWTPPSEEEMVHFRPMLSTIKTEPDYVEGMDVEGMDVEEVPQQQTPTEAGDDDEEVEFIANFVNGILTTSWDETSAAQHRPLVLVKEEPAGTVSDMDVDDAVDEAPQPLPEVVDLVHSPSESASRGEVKIEICSLLKLVDVGSE